MMSACQIGRVISVAKSGQHTFSKIPCATIQLIENEGVVGDAHAGTTVKHRSRVARDPNQPNLRQVHLIGAELLQSLKQQGFTLKAGDIGENILTEDLDLLALPEDTALHFARGPKLQVKGLRNPCTQLDDFMPGLMPALRPTDASGKTVLMGGIMTIVLTGGEVRPGDTFTVHPPALPHRALKRV